MAPRGAAAGPRGGRGDPQLAGGDTRSEPRFVQRVKKAPGHALQEVGKAQGVRGRVVGAWCSRQKALGLRMGLSQGRSWLSALQLSLYLLRAVRCPRTGRRAGKMGCSPIVVVRYQKYKTLPA